MENLENKKLKKGKTDKKSIKGITLIALIITIIVLLILAGVTIATLTGENGILIRAAETEEKTEQATEEEQKTLLEYEYELAKIQGKIDATETFGEYSMEKEINEKYGVDIKIGDTVNYKAENDYDGTWKLLGIEDGKILLMSSKPVTAVTLYGKDGYLNGVDKLDEACAEYGKGEGAECARSLRVEDINRISGYNPEKTGDGKRYGSGTIGEYGNKVKFERTIDGVRYEPEVGTAGIINGEFFTDKGETLGWSSLCLESTAYKYTLGTCENIKNPNYSDIRWDNLMESYPNETVWLGNSNCCLSTLEGENPFVIYGFRVFYPKHVEWRGTSGFLDVA